MNEQINVAKLAEWGPFVRSVESPDLVVTTAKPGNAFWDCWREHKHLLKSMGVSVSKQDGLWAAAWTLDEQAIPSGFVSLEQDDQEQSGVVAEPMRFESARASIPFIPTEEQDAIFRWFLDLAFNEQAGKRLVIRARAGTGKTTTVKYAFSFVRGASVRMLYAVFNKRNQREAAEKIKDSRVEVRTLHSVGLMFIKNVWRNARPAQDGEPDAEWDRIRTVCPEIPDEVAGSVFKLVAFAKNLYINPSLNDLVEICEERDLDAGDCEGDFWNKAAICEVAIKVLELSKKRQADGRISFNDMVWLPVAMDWVRPWFDIVVVDECQDMNRPQLEMARRAVRENGHFVVVGDDRQCIYTFRGAVPDAIDMMKRELDATEMGLTVTQRCPKAAVALVQPIVPDFKAAANAKDGVIEYGTVESALAALVVGDAVLSRLNAPLMPLCLRTLRKGIPARIEGKDIGKSLKSLARKIAARKRDSIPAFLKSLSVWQKKQAARAASSSKHPEVAIETINDQAETLRALAMDATSVDALDANIDRLFKDTDGNSLPAVVFSTVHKAKGLEWDKVVILKDTFNCKFGDPREEENIHYVACTRTKNVLVFAKNSDEYDILS